MPRDTWRDYTDPHRAVAIVEKARQRGLHDHEILFVLEVTDAAVRAWSKMSPDAQLRPQTARAVRRLEKRIPFRRTER